MNSTNHASEVLTTDPPVSLLKSLKVRALEPHEYQRAGELLDREHYLGDVPQGRQLLQAVEYDGQWVALLDWGPATWKLADREEWIGWTAQQKAERLGLVVLNRRFLVLGKTRMPNLASRSLALAIKALPEHWEQAHGYQPLLAETFSDIEQYEGTCYKASNWIACGQTKGFERHRIDYYRKHGRPKKLWLKTLNRNTRRILTAMDLPPAYRKALNTDTPERDLPLKKDQLQSLGEFLRKTSPIRAAPTAPFRVGRCWCSSPWLSLPAATTSRPSSDTASSSPRPNAAGWLSAQERHHLPQSPQLHRPAQPAHPNRSSPTGRLPQPMAPGPPRNPSPRPGHRRQMDPRSRLSLCLSDHETGAPAPWDLPKKRPKTTTTKAKTTTNAKANKPSP
jgi:hypothetical protein